MPCQGKRLTGMMVFWVNLNGLFLSLSKAKKNEAVVDAAEYGYLPYSAAQQIKVEHESSQVQAHSERVLLSELCFTYTLIHRHVCKMWRIATNEYSSFCLPMCCVVCQQIVIDSHYFKGLGFRGLNPYPLWSLQDGLAQSSTWNPNSVFQLSLRIFINFGEDIMCRVKGDTLTGFIGLSPCAASKGRSSLPDVNEFGNKEGEYR